MNRLLVLSCSLLTVGALAHSATASPKDEAALRDGCTWLDRALARDADRDDAFGMFMRGIMPKCSALLEALARGDKSVRAEGLRAVVSEIDELREIIDAEHGGPPPATGRPTPDEVARRKVEDERAGVDAEKARELEEKRRAAEEARRLEEEKKAAEEARRREEAEAKAREAEQRREEERRAKETDRERKAREAEERKAAAAAKKEAERLRREQEAADKRAAEEAKRAERERQAAEKKAEEEARRAEREREAAEKRAAEAARKEAEKRAKEQALAEAEARRLIEEAEREAIEEERRLAREKAAALVADELAAADEEARRERQKLAEESARKAAEDNAGSKAGADSPPAPAPRPAARAGGALDGTWEQPPAKVLDRNVKRTLNIFTKDGKIQGELFEEVWYPAPAAWVDRSCDGNTTFRMVTTARVSGEARGNRLTLWREVPRVLTCTCSSRCTVETRRRGMELGVGPGGQELSDASGVFVRPGTTVVRAGGTASSPEGVQPTPVVEVRPASFAGAWETPPFKHRDQTVIRRLELRLEGDKLVGELLERSSQALPLQSWSERFCQGATRWEWVTRWEVEGGSKGTELTLRAQRGNSLSCSCPSKCMKPKDKFTAKGALGTTGQTLTFDGNLFEQK